MFKMATGRKLNKSRKQLLLALRVVIRLHNQTRPSRPAGEQVKARRGDAQYFNPIELWETSGSPDFNL